MLKALGFSALIAVTFTVTLPLTVLKGSTARADEALPTRGAFFDACLQVYELRAYGGRDDVSLVSASGFRQDSGTLDHYLQNGTPQPPPPTDPLEILKRQEIRNAKAKIFEAGMVRRIIGTATFSSINRYGHRIEAEVECSYYYYADKGPTDFGMIPLRVNNLDMADWNRIADAAGAF